jgi:ribonucleoside-diphosphate reductase alpha chain
LQNLSSKFRGVHFEPAGLTGNPAIPTASSLVDYIFRWMELRFLGTSAIAVADTLPAKASARGKKRAAAASSATPTPSKPRSSAHPAAEATSTGISCPDCGAILMFAEGCMICRNCGYSRC